MTRQPDPAATARSTARGVVATWWYTVAGLIFFDLVLVLIWTLTLLQAGFDRPLLLAVVAGGVLWTASTLPLLRAYRQRTGENPSQPWRVVLVPLLVAAAFGVFVFAVSGLWMTLPLPLVLSLLLLDWPRSVRLRLVLAVTALLVCLWLVDTNTTFAHPPFDAVGDHVLYGSFSTLLPMMTALSLWWWDVLIALDRARVSEARLAATQERLSVATDVHDLQGHHLQVIALQLELAERLLRREDPDAALEQLRAARVSVDEARQGTRDLATRFRSVPLGDELANARDLLRAAGLTVEAEVAQDAAEAPAAVFGPVIRETTTNVLRHGGGRRARLALTREGAFWRYEIGNDVAGSAEPEAGAGAAAGAGAGAQDDAGEHSGLDGIARRAGEAGGTLEVRRTTGEFTVIVTAPASPASRAAQETPATPAGHSPQAAPATPSEPAATRRASGRESAR